MPVNPMLKDPVAGKVKYTVQHRTSFSTKLTTCDRLSWKNQSEAISLTRLHLVAFSSVGIHAAAKLTR